MLVTVKSEASFGLEHTYNLITWTLCSSDFHDGSLEMSTHRAHRYLSRLGSQPTDSFLVCLFERQFYKPEEKLGKGKDKQAVPLILRICASEAEEQHQVLQMGTAPEWAQPPSGHNLSGHGP